MIALLAPVLAALIVIGPGVPPTDDVETRSLLGVPLRAPVLSDPVRARREADLAEAIAAHTAQPDDELAAIWHGRRLAYLGRYRDAVDVFTEALQVHPSSVRLLRHRGHRFITLRRFDEAVRDLERAARLGADMPNAVEPDGMPNARNIPLSTTKGNVQYHLGLARYLQGDFDAAATAWRSCLELADNDDMACASAYWLYLALHRAGRHDDAAAVLDDFDDSMELIENFSYLRLLLLFKAGAAGAATPEVFRAERAGLDDATQAAGLAAWHLLEDDAPAARDRWQALLDDQPEQWAAFGFISAEAEIARAQGDPLIDLVRDFHALSSAPGVSVAVIDRRGTLRTACAGVADVETGRALAPHDRMLAGSTGKTFWGAAALQLVEEGILELDAPIARWLEDEPWFARLPNADDITLRMLFNHTSGLPRYVMLPGLVAAARSELDRSWTAAERLAFVLDLEPECPAGERWSYADTNYVVIGAIVEHATGRSFDELVRARILDRLGRSDLVFSNRRDLERMAIGYVDPSRNLFHLAEPAVMRDGRFAYNLAFEWAGGGFASTPRALAAWARDLYGGDVLDASTQAALRAGVPARLGGSDDAYGLGAMMRSGPGGLVVGHAGFMPGYLTDMAWYEGLGVAAAVQVNTTALGPALNPLTLRRLLDECARAVAR